MIKIIIFGIFLLISIAGIIYSVISLIKNRDKEYNGANILSFFIPLVGLIIYAVNIGKNDKLAKSCVKTALYGILATVCICLSCFFTLEVLHGVYQEKVNTVEGDKIKDANEKAKEEYNKINNQKETTKYDNVESALNDFKNDKIKSTESRFVGKLWYIEISFVNGTTEKEAKNITWDFFKKYHFEEQYDYNITISVDGKEYVGLFDGIQGNNVTWAN